MRAISVPYRNRGFSLIELMVAMVLGIVIVGGCLTIFSGVVRSSSVNQTISSLQSNARFALEQMGRDIRAAGFLGCASQRNVALNVTVNDPPTIDISRTAVTGYVVGASSSTWSPGLPRAYTPVTGVGAPVAGTHALSVQYAEYPGLELAESMTANTGTIVLYSDEDTVLRKGQLMVLSDCSSADLLVISDVGRSGTKTNVTTGTALTKPYVKPTSYEANAVGMPFVSTIYYIGNTGRTTESGTDVYSLYAHSYPYTTANPPVEMVEGAELLVLEFGVRQTDGSLRYVTAGANGYRDDNIESVRVGLLLSSLERFNTVDMARGFVLAGQSVSAAVPADESNAEQDTGDAGDAEASTGTPTPGTTSTVQTLTYVSDKRMRIPFNATFNVRNRNL